MESQKGTSSLEHLKTWYDPFNWKASKEPQKASYTRPHLPEGS